MGEKYVLKIDSGKRFDRLCVDLLNMDLKSFDYKETNMIKSSLTILMQKKSNILELIEDSKCPLNNISAKSLDTIFRYVKFMTELNLHNNYYRYKPLALLQTFLIIAVVDGKSITNPEYFLTSSRNIHYLTCGNFQETLKSKHTMDILKSICYLGKDSVYWKRVETYISYVK